jgi:hypothetical protein
VNSEHSDHLCHAVRSARGAGRARLAIRELVALVELRGVFRLGHLGLEVQRDVRQLLLDVAHDLALGRGGEAAPASSQARRRGRLRRRRMAVPQWPRPERERQERERQGGEDEDRGRGGATCIRAR